MCESWSERKKCRREMGAAGGIGLWGTGDFSPADTQIHSAQIKPLNTKKYSVLKHFLKKQNKLEILNTVPRQNSS